MKKLLWIMPLILLVTAGNAATNIHMNCMLFDFNISIDDERAVVDISHDTTKAFFNDDQMWENLRTWRNVPRTQVVLARDIDQEYEIGDSVRLAYVGHDPQTGQEILFQGWYSSRGLAQLTFNFIEDADFGCYVTVPFRLSQ